MIQSRKNQVIAAICQHAVKHYEEDGWDYVVEAYSDEEIWNVVKEYATYPECLHAVHQEVKVRDEVRKDIQGEIF